MEAKFPSQPATTPVDKTPYRTNPRPQQATEDCVNKMEDKGIIEQRASQWGSPVCVVAKPDGSPRLRLPPHDQQIINTGNVANARY